MIGNFYIEAGLKPNNVEDSSGFDDETYTKNVDNGTYSKESFVNDGAGYGLAQWTYSSRKKALYEYAKEKGTSIGDLNMQMEFLWKEMNSTHKSGLNYMKQNGVFDKVRGIWLGNYTHESGIKLEDILLDTIGDEFKGPIIKSENFGHIDKKTVIPIGTIARIDTNKDVKIELLENCLS